MDQRGGYFKVHFLADNSLICLEVLLTEEAFNSLASSTHINKIITGDREPEGMILYSVDAD